MNKDDNNLSEVDANASERMHEQDNDQGVTSPDTKAPKIAAFDPDAHDGSDETLVEDHEVSTPKKSGWTPVRAAIAIAAVAAIYTTHDAIKSNLEKPAIAFQVSQGVTDIDAALEAAALTGTIVKLTVGDGKTDILFAGAPECIHCQDFVSGEFKHYPMETAYKPMSLSALVAEGKKHNLDIAYMPLALSQIGLVIASAEACAAPQSSLTAVQRMKAGYDQVEMVAAAAKTAGEQYKDGVDIGEIQVGMTAAMQALTQSFAPQANFDPECYGTDADERLKGLKAYTAAFGENGTPSFFFKDGSGVVRKFSGSGGVSVMLDQISR
jgi:hypothetical protein